MRPTAIIIDKGTRRTIARAAHTETVFKTADVTLAVNGLPVATAESKNSLTGQRAVDVVRQHIVGWEGRDLLLALI